MNDEAATGRLRIPRICSASAHSPSSEVIFRMLMFFRKPGDIMREKVVKIIGEDVTFL
jgi:hypothetical protein